MPIVFFLNHKCHQLQILDFQIRGKGEGEEKRQKGNVNFSRRACATLYYLPTSFT